jgi:hypothetical protein
MSGRVQRRNAANRGSGGGSDDMNGDVIDKDGFVVDGGDGNGCEEISEDVALRPRRVALLKIVYAFNAVTSASWGRLGVVY